MTAIVNETLATKEKFALVFNSETPVEVLTDLLNSGTLPVKIRKQLAGNLNLPLKEVRKLATDPSDRVVKAITLRKDPNCVPLWWDMLNNPANSLTRAKTIQQGLAQNPFLPEKMAYVLLENHSHPQKLLTLLANNQETTQKMLTSILYGFKTGGKYASPFAVSTQANTILSILNHANCPPEAANIIAEEYDNVVLKEIIASRTRNKKLIDLFVDDTNTSVKETLVNANVTYCTPTQIHRMVLNANPETEQELLSILIYHTHKADTQQLLAQKLRDGIVELAYANHLLPETVPYFWGRLNFRPKVTLLSKGKANYELALASQYSVTETLRDTARIFLKEAAVPVKQIMLDQQKLLSKLFPDTPTDGMPVEWVRELMESIYNNNPTVLPTQTLYCAQYENHMKFVNQKTFF